MEPVKMPTRVDEPKQFLIWTVDEVIPILSMIGVGVVLEQVFLCMLVGWVLAYFYKKYKNSRPDGFIFHAFYWFGLMPSKKSSKTMVNPFIRRWFP